MESLVKILGAFIDTLVLNVYPTDHTFQVEERRVDPLLQEELKLLKEQAQEIKEHDTYSPINRLKQAKKKGKNGPDALFD